MAEIQEGSKVARVCECGHPSIWHLRGIGSCIECGCQRVELARVRDVRALMWLMAEGGLPWDEQDAVRDLPFTTEAAHRPLTPKGSYPAGTVFEHESRSGVVCRPTEGKQQ